MASRLRVKKGSSSSVAPTKSGESLLNQNQKEEVSEKDDPSSEILKESRKRATSQKAAKEGTSQVKQKSGSLKATESKGKSATGKGTEDAGKRDKASSSEPEKPTNGPPDKKPKERLSTRSVTTRSAASSQNLKPPTSQMESESGSKQNTIPVNISKKSVIRITRNTETQINDSLKNAKGSKTKNEKKPDGGDPPHGQTLPRQDIAMKNMSTGGKSNSKTKSDVSGDNSAKAKSAKKLTALHAIPVPPIKPSTDPKTSSVTSSSSSKSQSGAGTVNQSTQKHNEKNSMGITSASKDISLTMATLSAKDIPLPENPSPKPPVAITPKTSVTSTPKITVPSAAKTSVPNALKIPVPVSPKTTVPVTPKATVPVSPKTSGTVAPKATLPVAAKTTDPVAPKISAPIVPVPKTTIPSVPTNNDTVQKESTEREESKTEVAPEVVEESIEEFYKRHETESFAALENELKAVSFPVKLGNVEEGYLPVLSKDYKRTLSWPTDMVNRTQVTPSLSYSVNPLSYDFKSILGKDKQKSGESTLRNGEHKSDKGKKRKRKRKKKKRSKSRHTHGSGYESDASDSGKKHRRKKHRKKSHHSSKDRGHKRGHESSDDHYKSKRRRSRYSDSEDSSEDDRRRRKSSYSDDDYRKSSSSKRRHRSSSYSSYSDRDDRSSRRQHSYHSDSYSDDDRTRSKRSRHSRSLSRSPRRHRRSYSRSRSRSPKVERGKGVVQEKMKQDISKIKATDRAGSCGALKEWVRQALKESKASDPALQSDRPSTSILSKTKEKISDLIQTLSNVEDKTHVPEGKGLIVKQSKTGKTHISGKPIPDSPPVQPRTDVKQEGQKVQSSCAFQNVESENRSGVDGNESRDDAFKVPHIPGVKEEEGTKDKSEDDGPVSIPPEEMEKYKQLEQQARLHVQQKLMQAQGQGSGQTSQTSQHPVAVEQQQLLGQETGLQQQVETIVQPQALVQSATLVPQPTLIPQGPLIPRPTLLPQQALVPQAAIVPRHVVVHRPAVGVPGMSQLIPQAVGLPRQVLIPRQGLIPGTRLIRTPLQQIQDAQVAQLHDAQMEAQMEAQVQAVQESNDGAEDSEEPERPPGFIGPIHPGHPLQEVPREQEQQSDADVRPPSRSSSRHSGHHVISPHPAMSPHLLAAETLSNPQMTLLQMPAVRPNTPVPMSSPMGVQIVRVQTPPSSAISPMQLVHVPGQGVVMQGGGPVQAGMPLQAGVAGMQGVRVVSPAGVAVAAGSIRAMTPAGVPGAVPMRVVTPEMLQSGLVNMPGVRQGISLSEALQMQALTSAAIQASSPMGALQPRIVTTVAPRGIVPGAAPAETVQAMVPGPIPGTLVPAAIPASAVPAGGIPGAGIPGAGIPGAGIPAGAVAGAAVQASGIAGAAIQAGGIPAGAIPAGAVPAGAIPAGAVPAGAIPAGAVPAGVIPGSAVPGGVVPAGAVAGGALTGGAIPAEALSGALPAAMMHRGALPAAALPGAVQVARMPGAVPAGAIPVRSLTPGMIPRASPVMVRLPGPQVHNMQLGPRLVGSRPNIPSPSMQQRESPLISLQGGMRSSPSPVRATSAGSSPRAASQPVAITPVQNNVSESPLGSPAPHVQSSDRPGTPSNNKKSPQSTPVSEIPDRESPRPMVPISISIGGVPVSVEIPMPADGVIHTSSPAPSQRSNSPALSDTGSNMQSHRPPRPSMMRPPRPQGPGVPFAVRGAMEQMIRPPLRAMTPEAVLRPGVPSPRLELPEMGNPLPMRVPRMPPGIRLPVPASMQEELRGMSVPGAVRLPQSAVRLPPGAVRLPPGAIPQGAVRVPQGAVPVPQGAVPPGAVRLPQGAVPPGAVRLRPGPVPQGAAPPGAIRLPPDAVRLPPGAAPPGAVRMVPGAFRPPPGAFPPGAMPAGALRLPPGVGGMPPGGLHPGGPRMPLPAAALMGKPLIKPNNPRFP